MLKKRTRQQTRHTWFKLVEQWQKSGLSQAEFCRQHQIHSGNFYNWTAKYRRHCDQSSQTKPTNNIQTLIPVQLNTPSSALSISCGDIRIEFETGLSAEQTVAWIKTLRASLC